MKKSLALVAVGLFVLTSCTRSAEGQLPTPEMLSETLPSITEMPGDWNESQRQVFAVRGNENPSIDPSVWCPAAQEVTQNLIKLAGSTSSAGVTEKYSVIEGKDIGDESISWMQTTTPPASTQTEKLQTVGRTTVARFGSIIMVLQLGDMAFTDSVAPMNEDEWWDIVELAVKKLEALDEQVHK